MGTRQQQVRSALARVEKEAAWPLQQDRVRARAQLEFAAALLDAGKVEAEVGKKSLDAAVAAWENAVKTRTEAAGAVEAALAPFAETARAYTVHCVGHAHIDMNWMWNWPETVATTIDTLTTVEALMAEYPEFTFSQSQASIYRILQRFAPDLLDRVRDRVREGRWEVTASTWVEGDKNMACGEDICRQQLLTRRFLREIFGPDAPEVRIDFEPDLFGHPRTAPTLMAHGGARYMYFMRTGRGLPMFWFEGPDGSRLLAFDVGCYGNYNGVIDPGLTAPLLDFEAKTGFRDFLLLFGVGDHGGGPTRRDIETALWMRDWPVWPTVVFSTQHRFFETVEKHAGALPVIRDELNYVFEGCYTTQCRIKRANRLGPALLYEAELWSAIAARAEAIREYPRRQFNDAWEKVCFNQFHDILPGSGVPATVEYAQGLFQEVQAVTHSTLSHALRALDRKQRGMPPEAGRLAPAERGAPAAFSRGEGAGIGLEADSGRPSMVCRGRGPVRWFTGFNPSPWGRSGLVRARLWDFDLPPHGKLVAGHPDRGLRPVQVVGQGNYWGHHFHEILFSACEVPGCGFATCQVSMEDPAAPVEPVEDPASATVIQAGGHSHTEEFSGAGLAGFALENRLIRAEIDPELGRIRSLVDKRSGRELIPPESRDSLLSLLWEAPHGMTAWTIGAIVRRQDLLWDNAVISERGPYRAAIRCPFSFGRSHGALIFSLEQNSPTLRVRLDLHWLETGSPTQGVPYLKLRLPVAIDEPEAVYTLPFGSIRHPDRVQETPSIGRITVTPARAGGEQALSLFSDCKYGFQLSGGVIEVSLVRGAYEPDPYPDLGVHAMEFGLRPHPASLGEGAIQRLAFDFIHPFSVIENYGGQGEVRGGYLAVGPQNVMVAAFKQAEDGNGDILRLYELEGRDTEALVMLHPVLINEKTGVWLCNLHEEPRERLQRGGKGALRIPLKANSIATIRLAPEA